MPFWRGSLPLLRRSSVRSFGAFVLDAVGGAGLRLPSRTPADLLEPGERVVERLEGCIETSPLAAVVLVVGLGSDIADQLVEFVLASGQRDASLGGAGAEHEPFTGSVQEHEASQGGGHVRVDDYLDNVAVIVVDAAGS
jgi:hypothetical protein